MSWSTDRHDLLEACTCGQTPSRWPAWLPRMAFAPANKAPRGDTLVVVFLRGAADALNMVIPHGEDAYYRLRPTLGIPRPDDRKVDSAVRALDLDGFFGLHPALTGLLPPWQDGHLALVHACGAPDESRSHFRAMELMERGVTDERGPASGWVGRHLASLDTGNLSPLRAVGLGEHTQRSLQGRIPVTALKSIADFHLRGDLQGTTRMQAILAGMYETGDELAIVGQETLDVLRTLQALDPTDYRAANAAGYPSSDFGLGLKQVAMLVKADVGLEVAAIDVGGWDTHFAQGASEGLMAGLMQDLGMGLGAFHQDLGQAIRGVSVVVMSEFGRRAYENASLGTDHGHGSVMMLLGGNVVGSQVHGQWPGLEDGQLLGPGDLAVTTDYRDVLSELCLKRLNNQALTMVFPDFTPTVRGLFE